MTNKTINQLPNIELPILDTDKLLVSRDGLNVSKANVEDLPQVLTGAQKLNSQFAAGILNGRVIDSSGNIQNIQLDEYKYNPFGFNYYSLIYERLLGNTNAINRQASLLQYAKDCGSNLIRVMFPVFSGEEYLQRVHSTATMPSTVNDANLRSSFITACDVMMNMLAQYDQKILACFGWNKVAIPDAFGETYKQSVDNYLTSPSTQYVKSLLEWFVARYKNHPAFGIISFGNEYTYTEMGSADTPTSVNLGIYFKYLSDAVKAVRPNTLTTANIMSPNTSLGKNRSRLNSFLSWYDNIFIGLDIINIHIYADFYNFVGPQTQEATQYPNSSSNTLGYEGVRSLVSVYKAYADSKNKKLMIGEFGVSNDNELRANISKKLNFSNTLASYADTILVWNLQETSFANSIPNQITWFIDTGTATATNWQTIAKAINTTKPKLNFAGGGSTALRTSTMPRFTIGSDRVAGRVISLTSDARMSSTTGYTIMFWGEIKQNLNAFEQIARIGTSTTGAVIIGSATGNSTEFYVDARRSAGSAGNTAESLPALPNTELNHYTFIYTTINNQPTVQIWLNGIYWQTKLITALPDSIPVGTNIRILGGDGNVGTPIEIQDFTLLPFANNQDIWSHMEGNVLPHSMFHIRTNDNGIIYDASPNKYSLTIGSGITTQLSS